MHTLLHLSSVVLAASTSSKKATSSAANYSSLIFILLLGVLAYLFFVRPRSQQARRQRETLQEVGPGDEILTGAGIFGTVLDVEADRITIETAPGTRMTILRSTIARRITEPAEDAGEWSAAHENDDSPSGSGGSAVQLSNGHDPDDPDDLDDLHDPDEDHTWDEHDDDSEDSDEHDEHDARGAEDDAEDDAEVAESDSGLQKRKRNRKRGGDAAAGGEASSR